MGGNGLTRTNGREDNNADEVDGQWGISVIMLGVRAAVAAVDPFVGARVVRRLKPVGAAGATVELLEDSVVRKRYDTGSAPQLRAYERERTILEHLRGCSLSVQLLRYDDSKGLIYTQYAGESPKPATVTSANPHANRAANELIDRTLRELETTYSVTRTDNRERALSRLLIRRQMHYTLPDWGGVVVSPSTRRPRIVGYGAPEWIILPPPNPAAHLSETVFDASKERAILAHTAAAQATARP
jgi:hypothetical protein